jgi:hypothetical protein
MRRIRTSALPTLALLLPFILPGVASAQELAPVITSVTLDVITGEVTVTGSIPYSTGYLRILVEQPVGNGSHFVAFNEAYILVDGDGSFSVTLDSWIHVPFRPGMARVSAYDLLIRDFTQQVVELAPSVRPVMDVSAIGPDY